MEGKETDSCLSRFKLTLMSANIFVIRRKICFSMIDRLLLPYLPSPRGDKSSINRAITTSRKVALLIRLIPFRRPSFSSRLVVFLESLWKVEGRRG